MSNNALDHWGRPCPSLFSMPRPLILMNGDKKICEQLLLGRQKSLLTVYSFLSKERRRTAAALAATEKELQGNEYDTIQAKRNSKDDILVRAKKMRKLRKSSKRLQGETDNLRHKLAQLDSDLGRLKRAVKELSALEVQFGCPDLVKSCAEAMAAIESSRDVE